MEEGERGREGYIPWFRFLSSSPSLPPSFLPLFNNIFRNWSSLLLSSIPTCMRKKRKGREEKIQFSQFRRNGKMGDKKEEKNRNWEVGCTETFCLAALLSFGEIPFVNDFSCDQCSVSALATHCAPRRRRKKTPDERRERERTCLKLSWVYCNNTVQKLLVIINF